MRARIILACVACSLSSGCASIMCSDHKTISIQSDPPGADFEIENRLGVIVVKDTTPQTVTLKRGSDWFKQAGYLIRFQKDGYEPLRTTINQGFEAGWYLGGNLIFLIAAPVGYLIVDPLTGAMWTIEDVNVKLKPSTLVKTPEGTKQISGYEAHINPRTGVVETVPVYEPDKK